MKAAGDTIQIFGGIGFTWEHDAHLYFKRAKSTSLLLGSVDSYRDRLADAIELTTHD
jgi:alkylation response protein AidB-like acyl-CoA dehydrogenase